MTDVRTAVATIIGKHQYHPANHSSIGIEGHCGCGARPRDPGVWLTHVVDVLLSTNNLIIVELGTATNAVEATRRIISQHTVCSGSKRNFKTDEMESYTEIGDADALAKEIAAHFLWIFQ
jgi:hypothetical protein